MNIVYKMPHVSKNYGVSVYEQGSRRTRDGWRNKDEKLDLSPVESFAGRRKKEKKYTGEKKKKSSLAITQS